MGYYIYNGQVGSGILRAREALFFSTSQPRCWWEEGSGMDSNSKSENAQQEVPRRIHILGVGSIGVLVAHSISGIPSPPPITLLVHRPEHIDRWEQRGRSLNLAIHGVPEEREGLDMELIGGIDPSQGTTAASNDNEVIHNLIVTVKSHLTVPSLRHVAHRLRRKSTILFIQNGLGTTEKVSEELFPDPERRPAYIQGVISHGVWVREKFSAVLAGMGTLSLGIIPRLPVQQRQDDSEPEPMQPTSRYLISVVVRTPTLAAVHFPYTDLLQLQLEKLAVNCVLNPLTGVLDCHNGELLYNFSLSRVMRLLLAEISLVIRSLPELQGLPNVRARFSPERLETLSVGVMAKTAKNYSSMLQDVRKGIETEVESINGYIVRRGEELGIKCAMNYMILHLVEGKQRQVNRHLKGLLPLEMLDDES